MGFARASWRLAVPALLGSTVLGAGVAWAEDAAPAAPVDDSVIIVTAQKRSENLQTVPISIAALNGAKLQERQVTSFDDYAKLLPSVSFQSFGPGQSQIYFRGVSNGSNPNGGHSGSQPASALYLDELPLTTIGGAPDLHVYDIARVEALSGPQGTLFGASALSGTLRIITNAPRQGVTEAGIDLTGTTFAKGGNSSGATIEGFINLPVTSRIALRASAFYQRDGGYISNVPGTRTYDNQGVIDQNGATVPFGPISNAAYVKKNFNDVETAGGRLALGIDLDETWTATPSFLYQDQKSHGTFLFDPKVGDLQVQDFTPERGTDEWWQAALTVKGKLGNWDLTYVGGYFNRKTDVMQDYSAYTLAYDVAYPSYISFLKADGSNLDPTQTYRGRDGYTKQTHELRLSSPTTNRWRVTAGVFYERQTDHIRADYIIPGLAASQSGAVPLCGDDVFCTRVRRTDRDYAGFVDAAFDLLPNLTIDAGVRYFKVHNSLSGFSGLQSTTTDPNCKPTNDPELPCKLFDRTFKETGETHKFTLTWKATPDAMVYATYSTGYRPGGINRRVGVPPEYVSDRLNNYEIGVKTQWLDRHLTINMAAFIEDWKDLQVGLSSLGSVGVISFYNAGGARIKGIEGDFVLRKGPVTFSGSGTYIDAYLTTTFCHVGASGSPDCLADPTLNTPPGTALPTQPKFKGNLNLRYAFGLGSIDAYVQGSINHQGGTRSYLTDPEAGMLGNTKGFTTADFSLGGKLDAYTFELFVQNAFDSRGILSRNTVCVPSLCGAYARAYPIKPQMFGVKLGTRF